MIVINGIGSSDLTIPVASGKSSTAPELNADMIPKKVKTHIAPKLALFVFIALLTNEALCTTVSLSSTDGVVNGIAIKTAIASEPAQGSISFEAGTFPVTVPANEDGLYVGKALTISGASGSGLPTTTLLFNTNSPSSPNIHGFIVTASNVTFSRLGIDTNYAPTGYQQNRPVGILINQLGGDHLTVTGCWLRHSPEFAIGTFSDNCIVTNTQIEDSWGDGIHVSGGTGTLIQGNTIIGAHDDAIGITRESGATSHVYIDNNHIYNSKWRGIYVQDTPYTGITNNYIQVTASTAIQVTSTSSSNRVAAAYVALNQIYSAGDTSIADTIFHSNPPGDLDAIAIYHVYSSAVYGNYIYQPHRKGIVFSSFDGLDINGNQVINPIKEAIQLVYTPDKNISNKYDSSLYPDHHCDNLQVRNNYLAGCPTQNGQIYPIDLRIDSNFDSSVWPPNSTTNRPGDINNWFWNGEVSNNTISFDNNSQAGVRWTAASFYNTLSIHNNTCNNSNGLVYLFWYWNSVAINTNSPNNYYTLTP